ncbi:MAG: hypothetical protein AAGG65_04985 [Pseudomonadota bacterium]
MDRDLVEIATLAIEVPVRSNAWSELCDQISSRLVAAAFMVIEFDIANKSAPIFHNSRSMQTPKALKLIETVRSGGGEEDHPGYETVAASAPGQVMGESEFFGFQPGENPGPNSFRDAVLNATGGKARTAMRLNDVGPWLDAAISHDTVPSFAASPAFVRDGWWLLPILSKAIDASRFISSLVERYTTLLSLFDRLAFAAAFCDLDGKIITENATMRHISSERDGFWRHGAQINAAFSEDQKSLNEAMSAAGRFDAAPESMTFTISKRSDGLPYVVKVLPLSDVQVHRQRVILLVILDPDAPGQISAEGLASFGVLSSAELDVCDRLILGMTTREISEARNTAYETTRSQIKSASLKLGIQTQLDLLRLAMITKPPLDVGHVTKHPPIG